MLKEHNADEIATMFLNNVVWLNESAGDDSEVVISGGQGNSDGNPTESQLAMFNEHCASTPGLEKLKWGDLGWNRCATLKSVLDFGMCSCLILNSLQYTHYV